jgi:hypothetical protein
MIIIETNKNKDGFHDLIKYAPLEKQLFEILSTKFQEITYEFDKKFMNFYVGDITIEAQFKNSVKLTVTSMSRDWFDDFHIGDTGDHYAKNISTTLNFNKDVTKKLDEFFDKINTIQNNKNIAKPIFNKINDKQVEKREAIEKFLNKYFGNKYIKVTFWYDTHKFFDGLGVGLSIHLKGSAPGDGVYMQLETDGTLDTFWNCSTKRRTHSVGQPETIEKAISRMDFGGGVAGMKTKIETLEALEKKVKEFDYTKCPELLELIELKKKANKIKEEVAAI